MNNFGTFVSVALKHFARDTSIPNAELVLDMDSLFALNKMVENRRKTFLDILKSLVP